MKYKQCHFTPPAEIYGVLNQAVEKGIIFPEDVMNWFLTEMIIETKKDIQDLKNSVKKEIQNDR
jgi:hypothetical protein